jgi:hypothetical protein
VAGVVLGSCLFGCATQAQTGQVLAAAGTAALIAGAVMADDGCYGDFERGYERGRPCEQSGGSDKTGAIVAAAGLGVALVGNALVEDAARLDARRSARPAPSYVPATFPPPPGFAPAGTFQVFPPPAVAAQTVRCACPAPPKPACTSEGASGSTPASSATPGNEEAPGVGSSAATGTEAAPAEPAACPCPSPAATPEAEPKAEPEAEPVPEESAPAGESAAPPAAR